MEKSFSAESGEVGACSMAGGAYGRVQPDCAVRHNRLLSVIDTGVHAVVCVGISRAWQAQGAASD